MSNFQPNPEVQAATQRMADRKLALKAQAARTIIVEQLSQPGQQARLRRTYKVVSHKTAKKLGLKGKRVLDSNGKEKRRVANSYKEVRVSAPGDSPAVQTGRLRQSIGVQKVADAHYRVGTNVEYAPYLEYGTRHMAARPFMRPALEKVKNLG